MEFASSKSIFKQRPNLEVKTLDTERQLQQTRDAGSKWKQADSVPFGRNVFSIALNMAYTRQVHKKQLETKHWTRNVRANIFWLMHTLLAQVCRHRKSVRTSQHVKRSGTPPHTTTTPLMHTVRRKVKCNKKKNTIGPAHVSRTRLWRMRSVYSYLHKMWPMSDREGTIQASPRQKRRNRLSGKWNRTNRTRFQSQIPHSLKVKACITLFVW